MSEHKNDSFLKETVKDEQITGKRIIRAVFKTIGKGLLFGLAACLVFYVLKPWSESDGQQASGVVSIPKDETEEESEAVDTTEDEKMTAENYREMSEALNDVAKEARKCMVEISGKDVKADWKEDDEVQSISGVIVWDNGINILIWGPRDNFKEKEEVLIRFSNGKEVVGQLKQVDKNHNMGIYSVPTTRLNESIRKVMKVAELGNSYILGKGAPVIALGMQFGYSDGMGYGVISSIKNSISISDYKYSLLTTDITAASQGSGVLFNIDGQVVGLVDQKRTDTAQVNLVSGYAISELKEVIELLSNGQRIPYLGIKGIEVTKKISEEEGIPMGLYVKEVEAESPAMEAGIQCGDIIVKMNGLDVITQKGYSNALMKCTVGTRAGIEVMRLGVEEYEKINLNAIVGSK